MKSIYIYRSHKVKADGTLSKSNLNSRPYTDIVEVLADNTLSDPRYYVHNFVTDKWYQVINGWLTRVEAPQ